jgi:hypothetical protein
MAKCDLQRNPLVVVVVGGFSATTTIEKSRKTNKHQQKTKLTNN